MLRARPWSAAGATARRPEQEEAASPQQDQEDQYSGRGPARPIALLRRVGFRAVTLGGVVLSHRRVRLRLGSALWSIRRMRGVLGGLRRRHCTLGQFSQRSRIVHGVRLPACPIRGGIGLQNAVARYEDGRRLRPRGRGGRRLRCAPFDSRFAVPRRRAGRGGVLGDV